MQCLSCVVQSTCFRSLLLVTGGYGLHALLNRWSYLLKPDFDLLAFPLQMQVLGLRRIESIAESHTEGDLWQADHRIPVAEGGGECDISNYRTLCTACHQQETAALHRRLKGKAVAERHASGTKDIRSMFSARVAK